VAESDGEGVGGDVGSRPLVAPNEARPVAVAFPGGRFALSNIPMRVPLHFLGRDDSLAEIEAALKRASTPTNHNTFLGHNPPRSDSLVEASKQSKYLK
jgi:hypothetical protein